MGVSAQGWQSFFDIRSSGSRRCVQAPPPGPRHVEHLGCDGARVLFGAGPAALVARARFLRVPLILLSVLAGLLLVYSPRVNAQETSVDLDPAATTIEFTLGATMHTVHGAFNLRSGHIVFEAA